MICCKCNNDLAACVCADLEERLDKIKKCEFLHIGADYERRIREQVERNKTEQTAKE